MTRSYISKTGDRWTDEESEQLKRLVFKYTCECYSCTAMADEFKKYFPWRSTGSLLGRISNVRQSCSEELGKFYSIVVYGGVVLKNAQCYYNVDTRRIEFGSYISHRILQMIGLIPAPEIKKDEDKRIKKLINDEIKGTWCYIYKRESKHKRPITINETAELLSTEPENIEGIIKELNIKGDLSTKHLLSIALQLDNGVGGYVRSLQDASEEVLKMRIRSAKWSKELSSHNK